jgi:hypothetical protein
VTCLSAASPEKIHDDIEELWALGTERDGVFGWWRTFRTAGISLLYVIVEHACGSTKDLIGADEASL